MKKAKKIILIIVAVILVIVLIPVGTVGILVAKMQDETKASIDSVTEPEDGFFLMDYTYDYDLDTLLEDGVSDSIKLIFKGINDTVLGNGKGLGGCTTFNAQTEDGDTLFARNYDYMDGGFLFLWTHPSDGYASVSSVSLYVIGLDMSRQPDKFPYEDLLALAPFYPVDGMNEKGLSIGVLELETDPTHQDEGMPDMPTTLIIRAVLDRCATVSEAIDMFASYDIQDDNFGGCAYHYQITDATGASCVIEFVNNEMRVIYPDENADGYNWMTAANYYLSEDAVDPNGLGRERTQAVKDALTPANGITDKKSAMNILSSAAVYDEDMLGYICSTIWSVVYDTADKTADICYYGDYSKTYSFDISTPLEYTLTEN